MRMNTTSETVSDRGVIKISFYLYSLIVVYIPPVYRRRWYSLYRTSTSFNDSRVRKETAGLISFMPL